MLLHGTEFSAISQSKGKVLKLCTLSLEMEQGMGLSGRGGGKEITEGCFPQYQELTSPAAEC